MVFKYAIFIFLILFILGVCQKQRLVTPAVAAMYGLTSIIMTLFYSSQWTPIFMMRYFLYIFGVLLIIVVPIVLLALVILIFQREVRNNHPHRPWRKYFNAVASLLIISFFIYSLWTLLTIKTVQVQIILGMYSSIAIYFTALFIAYCLANYLIKWLTYRTDRTLIMVLGTDIDDDGKIRSDLRKRLNKAVTYYQTLTAQEQTETYFLVSGGNPTEDGITEAQGMANYLIELGIDEKQIIKEPSARNTRENILFSKPFFQNIGYKRQLLIVTSSYHLLRTYHFVHKLGVKAAFFGAKTALLGLPFALVREFIAMLLLTKELSLFFIIYLLVTQFLQTL